MKDSFIILLFLAALVCVAFGVAQAAEDTTDLTEQLEMCYTLNERMNKEYDDLYREYDQLYDYTDQVVKKALEMDKWIKMHTNMEHPSI